MNKAQLFTTNESSFYSEVLDFLEEVYARRGPYQIGNVTKERTMDVLILNFTKVVNDCRSILLLTQGGFCIQAGIIARSTSDACNLMMHIAFEGEDAALVRQWLVGKRVTHWNLVERLNKQLKYQINIDAYKNMRKRLDDFVHANYQALKLYPQQSPGPTPMYDKSFRELIFWKDLVYLYLISCLLVVSLIVPDLEGQATMYLDRLLDAHKESISFPIKTSSF